MSLYCDVMCNFKNIYKAYKLAHRGKSEDSYVIEFDKRKMYNLKKLQSLLINKKWEEIFKYYRFTIRRPKERIVDAMTFEGRIVQHILCDEILKDWFEKRLIHTNCACRKNKGTDFASNKTKEMLVKFLRNNNNCYVLKMDIHKYFPNINCEVLKNLLSKFYNKEIRDLLYWLIDNNTDDKGIPIGNQTSQWFALYYLDKIDRIIKEKFRFKYYCRYMDDFYIIHDDKNVLKTILVRLREELKRLKLEFNPKTQTINFKRGFSFLAWRFLCDKNKAIIKRIDSKKLKDRKITLKKNAKLFRERRITKREYIDRCISMHSNICKGNTYKIEQNLKYNFMIKLANKIV